MLDQRRCIAVPPSTPALVPYNHVYSCTYETTDVNVKMNRRAKLPLGPKACTFDCFRFSDDSIMTVNDFTCYVAISCILFHQALLRLIMDLHLDAVTMRRQRASTSTHTHTQTHTPNLILKPLIDVTPLTASQQSILVSVLSRFWYQHWLRTQTSVNNKENTMFWGWVNNGSS